MAPRRSCAGRVRCWSRHSIRSCRGTSASMSCSWRRRARAPERQERRELMSGHSKWATIKHKKGAQDAARGKLFAKLIRQVEVAAREGGGDLTANATLRTMYQKARDASIPLDTI